MELKAIVTVDLANMGHMKLELFLSPVQARDPFYSTHCWMGFVCNLDLDTSDSATCAAHATHLPESTPETHRLCADYLIEVESNLQWTTKPWLEFNLYFNACSYSTWYFSHPWHATVSLFRIKKKKKKILKPSFSLHSLLRWRNNYQWFLFLYLCFQNTYMVKTLLCLRKFHLCSNFCILFRQDFPYLDSQRLF